MSDLQTKIKELEAKHKAEKAKLMTKYRADEKKKQATKNKHKLAEFEKYCKLMNNDLQLIFGCLQNGVNAINKQDDASKQKLDYFRGLVQPAK